MFEVKKALERSKDKVYNHLSQARSSGVPPWLKRWIPLNRESIKYNIHATFDFCRKIC